MENNNINLSLIEDFQKKILNEMNEKIYNRVNSKIEKYIQDINFSKEAEESRLENINLANYRGIQRAIANICDLCTSNRNISKPEKPERHYELYNKARKEYDNYYYNYGPNSYEVYQAQERLDYYGGEIKEYQSKLERYNKALDKCKVNIEEFKLSDFNVTDIDYNELYNKVKGDVLNERKITE